MTPQSIKDYIWLGLVWRYLQDVEAGHPLHGDTYIIQNLENLFSELNRFELFVTGRAASEIEDLYDAFKNTPQGTNITKEEAKKLNENLSFLQKTLSAEASGKITFILSDKKIEVEKLLN